MKVQIIDIYPDNGNKSCKDTGGGYGTSHDYGISLFSKFIRLFVRKNISFPPIYLAYVISSLKSQGHSVNISYDFEHSMNADCYIVISSIIAHELEIELIKKIGKISDNIIVCGAFARFNSKRYIEAGAKVLKAEPEIIFERYRLVDLLEDYNRLENITLEKEITLPLPSWDQLISLYNCKLSFLSLKKMVPIYMTKGCPFSCSTYCTYPLEQGSTVRAREIPELIKEIIYIQERYNIYNFLFRDPVFTINKNLVINFCNQLEHLKVPINFAIETHLELLDEELIKKLAAVGLKLIYLGVESSSEEVCDKEGRYTSSFHKQKEMVEILEKYNVDIKIMYIIGFPSERKEVFEINKKLAKIFNPLYIQLNIFTPYPATAAYDNIKAKLITSSYMDFNQSNLVFEHDEYSPKEVKRMISEFYIDFYLRPIWFIKFIRSIILRLFN